MAYLERFFKYYFVVALIPAYFQLPCYSQIGGSGSIQGTVTDSSGGAIPGATITATNTATGVVTTRQTTAAGLYVLSPLSPGEYNLNASAKGFQAATRQHVVVDALAQVPVNLQMQVGGQTQSVTVTSNSEPALDTVNASMGQTVRNQTYNALPLAMGNAPRDPTAFVSLMPGVTSSSAAGNTAGNVMGGEDHTQEVYVEGLPITNPVAEGESRTLGLGISVEAVDQFQLESAGTAVEYQGQGASNFVLKSGTNSFHGTAYEFFRNTNLDARGFFARTTPVEHQNEFGFNVGGPIKKNKLFFFGGYDGFRFTQGAQPSFQTIPTLGERAGDFSALGTPVYDPTTTSCTNGLCTRMQFPSNMIPASRISPVSKYFQSFLPTPTNGNIQNNYLGTVPVGYMDNSTADKVDYTMNDKNTFYWLFSRGHRSQTTPYRGQTLPLPYANTRLVDELPTTAQMKWTYVATPSLLNQLAVGLSRFEVPITNATISGDYPTKAGLTGLPAGEAASSFPEVSWSGPETPTGWRGTNARAFNEILNTFSLQDNVQWTHGAHSITIGFQFLALQANESERTYGSLATWNFSNNQTAGFGPTGSLLTSTGNAYASYLLGALNSASVIQDSVVEVGGRYKDYSWWFQDNYKVSPKLTLNLGLRHDIWGPYKEVLNRESFFNPNAPNPAAGGHPGILEFYGNGPDSCHCDTTVNTDYLNLGPRVGIAYAPSNNIVIRAGYSIMYTHRGATGGRAGARTGTDILGFSATPNFVPLQPYDPAFYWDNGVPAYQKPPFFDPRYGAGFAGGSSATSMNYGDPNIGGKPPRYQNWNFAVERALAGNAFIGAAYVGSKGNWLGMATNGGGRGIWSDQLNPIYLALGSLLTQSATPANLAAANRILPGIGLPFPGFVGSIAQALRPYPQYTGINDPWGDVGNSSYNSLQVYINKRLSHGLSVNFNYTYAKGFDDTNANMPSGQSYGDRSAYSWSIERAESPFPRQTVNGFFVYELPFGKGRTWLKSGAAGYVAGGWQISGIVTYRSGTPIGTIGTTSCNVSSVSAGGCYATYNPAFSGPVRINGGWGSGNLLGSNPATFLSSSAFVSPTALAYSYGSAPRTGAYSIFNPGMYDADISLRREFPIYERVKLVLQADALNILNFVNFAPPSTNITSSGFGRITGQANAPRIIQLVGRITF